MRKISSFVGRSVILVSLLCVSFATSAASGADQDAGASPPKAKSQPKKKAHRGAVTVKGGKASVDFNETSMRDAVYRLQDATGITIVLHPDLLEANPTISLKVNNMSLGMALKWICQLSGARYVLVDHAIYIVPKVGMKRRPRTIVVDTRDLTRPVPNFAGPELVMGGNAEQGTSITLTETESSPRGRSGGDGPAQS